MKLKNSLSNVKLNSTSFLKPNKQKTKASCFVFYLPHMYEALMDGVMTLLWNQAVVF